MQYRTMRITDYTQVYALWLSVSGMGLNSIDDTEDGIARFLSRNPNTCFVAETNGQIVGAILAGQDGRRGYIYHTAVAENRRREGVGASLVRLVLEALRKDGVAKVALVAFERNEQGNLFWEKQGFTKREDLVYRNRTLMEFIRMDT